MIFEQKRLDELGTIITGKTPSTKNEEFWDGKIPFVTPKDIQGTKHIFETERYITHKGLNSVKGARLPIGAICVSCIGNIGYLGITMHECVSNQQINSLIVNGDNDKDYVYYLLKSMWPYFKNYEGQSTTLSILNKTQFSKIIVEVPSLANQKKISSILSKIDEKIELNNKINNNLEQQARLLFKSWFVDYLPFGCIVPTDWQTMTLGEVSNMSAGGDKPKVVTQYRDETCKYPIYSNGLSDDGLYGYTNEPKIFDESVTVSARGTIGFVCLRHIPYVPIVRLVTLIPKANVMDAKYLYLYLNQLHIRGTGTTQQQLTVPDFRKTTILVPTKSVLDHFSDIVTPLFTEKWANDEENSSLADLRNTLLPKLLSGELDVSDIDL